MKLQYIPYIVALFDCGCLLINSIVLLSELLLFSVCSGSGQVSHMLHQLYWCFVLRINSCTSGSEGSAGRGLRITSVTLNLCSYLLEREDNTYFSLTILITLVSKYELNWNLSSCVVFLGAFTPGLPQVVSLWLLSSRTDLLQFPVISLWQPGEPFSSGSILPAAAVISDQQKWPSSPPSLFFCPSPLVAHRQSHGSLMLRVSKHRAHRKCSIRGARGNERCLF